MATDVAPLQNFLIGGSLPHALHQSQEFGLPEIHNNGPSKPRLDFISSGSSPSNIEPHFIEHSSRVVHTADLLAGRSKGLGTSFFHYRYQVRKRLASVQLASHIKMVDHLTRLGLYSVCNPFGLTAINNSSGWDYCFLSPVFLSPN
jgi:hypothetical protein